MRAGFKMKKNFKSKKGVAEWVIGLIIFIAILVAAALAVMKIMNKI